MAQVKVDAKSGQIVDHAGEAVELQSGERLVRRIVAVRRREMREDALKQDVVQTRDQAQLLKRVRVLVGKEAEPGHAGVELDVGLEPAARALHRVVELDRVFHRVDLLPDAHVGHVLGVVGRGVAQDQDRQTDAAAAQLDRLLDVGHSQIVRAELRQTTADRQGAVAVGVGLDHAQKPAVGRDQTAQHTVIMGQIVQGHVRPGPLQQLHSFLRYSLQNRKGPIGRRFSPAVPALPASESRPRRTRSGP